MKIIPKLQSGGEFKSLFPTYREMITQATQPEKTTKAGRTTQAARSSSDEDDSKGKLTEKDLFNMVKDIDGLPNEMQSIMTDLMETFNIKKLLGESQFDIYSTYLQTLYKMRTAIGNKKQYDEAYKSATTAGATMEPAITGDGKLLVQKENGNIQKVSLEDYMENKDSYGQALTVSNLLNLRAYSPEFAYNYSTIDIVNNSMGYTTFQKLIKEAVTTLGSNSVTQGGVFDGQEAVKGLEVLKSLQYKVKPGTPITPDELYKYKIIDKNQKNQINALTSYILALLPENAKVWAALKLGTDDKVKATTSLITTYLSASENVDKEVFMEPAKSSKESNENEKDSADTIPQNIAIKWLRGLGVQESFVINPGTNYATIALSNTLPITDSSGNYIGSNSLLQQVTQGDYAGILDFNNASMGMNRIDSTNFGKVVLTDGKISSVDFPFIQLSDGTIVPDLSPKTAQAKLYADRDIKKLGVDLSNPASISANYKAINDIYTKYGLQPAYNPDGTPTNNWMRFGVINASASNNTLGMDQSDSTELLQTIIDDTIVDNLIQITKEENYDRNRWGGVDHFYRGTLWIPVKRSYIAASANSNMKTNQIQEIITRENALEASKMLTKEKK